MAVCFVSGLVLPVGYELVLLAHSTPVFVLPIGYELELQVGSELLLLLVHSELLVLVGAHSHQRIQPEISCLYLARRTEYSMI